MSNTDTQTHTQTQTHTDTHRHTDTQTDRHTHTHTHRHRHRHRHTYTQTHTHTHILNQPFARTFIATGRFHNLSQSPVKVQLTILQKTSLFLPPNTSLPLNTYPLHTSTSSSLHTPPHTTRCSIDHFPNTRCSICD